MDLRLDGKVALVTGGSRGIGLAVAARFLEAGASVMLSSRKEAGLVAAAQSLNDRCPGGEIGGPVPRGGASGWGEVDWYVSNAGDSEQADACVAATIKRFGGFDVLVNNAATNPHFGPIIEIDDSRMAKTVQVNQSGALAWTRAAYHAAWSAGGPGVVLNMSSIGGMAVEPNIGWYNVTKAALIHLTSQLAGELGPGVRVNAVAPGLVKTDLARALWEPAEEAIAARLPLRRLGEPDDIAKAALFLCSDAASWITGHTLVVDGGALSMPFGGLS